MTTEVLALFGRGACFKAPFSSSISNTCRPTSRSRAAILASYSCIRSAACTSSSNAPASNLPTQIRISCREMSCCLDNACSVSPAMNSFATCRLNAALCERCFVMASILRKPSTGGQFKSPILSTHRGALQWKQIRCGPARHDAAAIFDHSTRKPAGGPTLPSAPLRLCQIPDFDLQLFGSDVRRGRDNCKRGGPKKADLMRHNVD